MKSKELFAFPLPGCSHQESRVLRQLVVWADEYLRKKAASKSKYVAPPTTEQCTKHFQVTHKDMLGLLNRLERDGLVSKERRLSAGLSGNGYDGSLHSSVLPTMKARELVARSQR